MCCVITQKSADLNFTHTSKQTYYISLFTHKSSTRAVCYKLLKMTLNKPQRKIQHWGVYTSATPQSLYLIFNEKEYRTNKPCDCRWVNFHFSKQLKRISSGSYTEIDEFPIKLRQMLIFGFKPRYCFNLLMSWCYKHIIFSPATQQNLRDMSWKSLDYIQSAMVTGK